jgi:hypothetical protein
MARSNPKWSRVPQETQLQDYRWTVTNTITGASQFYRLRSRSEP